MFYEDKNKKLAMGIDLVTMVFLGWCRWVGKEKKSLIRRQEDSEQVDIFLFTCVKYKKNCGYQFFSNWGPMTNHNP